MNTHGRAQVSADLLSSLLDRELDRLVENLLTGTTDSSQVATQFVRSTAQEACAAQHLACRLENAPLTAFNGSLISQQVVQSVAASQLPGMPDAIEGHRNNLEANSQQLAERVGALATMRRFTLEDATGTVVLGSTWWSEQQPNNAAIGAVIARLRALPDNQQSRARPWATALTAISEARDNLTHAVTNFEAAVARQPAARASLLADLKTRLLAYFAQHLAEQVAAAGVTRLTTNEAANYVSPESGFAIGRSNLARGVWFIPYVGINVYFAPVERSVPFGEQVGNSFVQRFSLTIAVGAAVEPHLRDATAHGLVGAAYPGLGFGVRLTRWTRVTALGWLFRADSTNLLSDQRRFGAVFSVGFSIDADIATILASALK